MDKTKEVNWSGNVIIDKEKDKSFDPIKNACEIIDILVSEGKYPKEKGEELKSLIAKNYKTLEAQNKVNTKESN